MALHTYSKFYYGHTINETNKYINFKENGSATELTAILEVGEYSLTDFVTEVARALNAAAASNITVGVDRATRILTVSTSGTINFLAGSGSQIGSGAFSLMGYVGDSGGFFTQLGGNEPSGFEWIPQFKAQDYVSFEDNQSAIDGVTRKTTSGRVEAVSFGTQKIMDCNWRFITNTQFNSTHPIKNDQEGYENARAFMKYAITKADLEFIPDIDIPNTFNKCLLESTPESAEGLGFKLKELYGIGLPDYYETGILKFRLIS